MNKKQGNQLKIIAGVILLSVLAISLLDINLGTISQTWGTQGGGTPFGTSPVGLTLSDENYDLKVVSFSANHVSSLGVVCEKTGNYFTLPGRVNSCPYEGQPVTGTLPCQIGGGPYVGDYGLYSHPYVATKIQAHLIANDIDLGVITFTTAFSPVTNVIGGNPYAASDCSFNYINPQGKVIVTKSVSGPYNVDVSLSHESTYQRGYSDIYSNSIVFNGFSLKNPVINLDTSNSRCIRSANQALIEQVFDEGVIHADDLKYTPDKLCLSVPAVLTKESGATYANRDVVLELARDGVTSAHPGETIVLFYISTPSDISTFCKGETEVWIEEEGKCQILETGDFVDPVTPDLLIVCEKGSYDEELDVCVYTAQTQSFCPTGTYYNEVSLRCEYPISLSNLLQESCFEGANDFDWNERVCLLRTTFDPEYDSEECPNGLSIASQTASGEIFIISCSDNVVLSVTDICGDSDYNIDVDGQVCTKEVTVVSTPICSSGELYDTELETCVVIGGNDYSIPSCPAGSSLSGSGECLAFPSESDMSEATGSMSESVSDSDNYTMWVIALVIAFVVGGFWFLIGNKKW